MAALTLIRNGLRQRIRLVDMNNFSVELRCVLPVEAEAGFQWVRNFELHYQLFYVPI